MGIEIERKFLLINDDYKKESFQEKMITQGFLNSNKNRVVRVRISDDTAFITVKGITNQSGTSRFEWEKKIPKTEAEELLLLCEPNLIVKKRYHVKKGNHIFEIDEFYENNKGLVIAEIELNDAQENFEKPLWLGKEVTGIEKYYNSNLLKNPFKDW